MARNPLQELLAAMQAAKLSEPGDDDLAPLSQGPEVVEPTELPPPAPAKSPSVRQVLSVQAQLSGRDGSAGGKPPLPEPVDRPEMRLTVPNVQAPEAPDYSVPSSGPLPALPKDASIDWKARAGEARGDANKLRLIANVGRAGEVANAALAGRKSDGSGYNSLDEQAELVEKRLPADIQMEEMARKFRETQALKDPNSPVNVRIRATIPNAYRKLLGDSFNSMTGTEISERIPVLKEGIKTQLEAANNANKLTLDKAKLQNDVELKIQERADKADEANRAGYKLEHPEKISPLLLAQAGVEGRQVTSSMEGVTKKFQDIMPLATSLRGIEQIAPGLITKSDGGQGMTLTDRVFRKLPKGAGSRFTPEQIRQLDTATREVMLGVTNKLFGASLTEHEQARIDAAAGEGLLSDPEVQAQFLNIMGKKLASEVRLLGSPYRTSERGNLKAAFEALEDDTGLSTERDPFLRSLWEQARPRGYGGAPSAPQTSAPAPASAPPAGKVRVSNGVETLLIDASDLMDALREGYKRVK